MKSIGTLALNRFRSSFFQKPFFGQHLDYEYEHRLAEQEHDRKRNERERQNRIKTLNPMGRKCLKRY